MISVKVRCMLPSFSTKQIELHLEDGASIMNAMQELVNNHAKELKNRIYDANSGTYTVAFIVNKQYVKPTKSLEDGDELTVLPVVAGG